MDQEKDKIIHEFIITEVAQIHNNLAADQQHRLSYIIFTYYENDIPEEEARKVVMSIGGSTMILEKIKKIHDLSPTPLPKNIQEPSANNKKECSAKRKKSYPWSEAEDNRLLRAVNDYGPRDWKKIAKFVGAGRSSSQCIQRWRRALDPQINKSSWTPEEDSNLLRAVEKFGRTTWCQVAKFLGGRTDLQCRYRYLQLNKTGKVMNNDQTEDSPDFLEKQQKSKQEIKKTYIQTHTIKTVQQKSNISEAVTLNASMSIPLNENGNNKVEDVFLFPLQRNPIPASFEMPPYYLESTLVPRKDQSQSLLHRVPPLLLVRKKVSSNGKVL